MIQSKISGREIWLLFICFFSQANMMQSQFENYYLGLEWPYTPSFPSMFLMWIYCPTSNFLTETPFIKIVPACMVNYTLSLIHLICKHWNNIFRGKCKIPLKVLKRWSQESWSPKRTNLFSYSGILPSGKRLFYLHCFWLPKLKVTV